MKDEARRDDTLDGTRGNLEHPPWHPVEQVTEGRDRLLHGQLERAEAASVDQMAKLTVITQQEKRRRDNRGSDTGPTRFHA